MAKRITDDKKGGVEFGKFRRNIMGTTSFEFKLPNMRKMQDFIVYPATSGDTSIMIQSGTRIGRINMSNGEGMMSQSHASGAYGVHLQFDKLVPFLLTADQLSALKEQVAKTAGSSVGSSVVKSDNSGADKFAKGGKLKPTYIPNENIESIKTRFGQTFSGKDVLDGAYVKGEVKTPKVARYMFEEEEYEYADGGAVENYTEFDPHREGKLSGTVFMQDRKGYGKTYHIVGRAKGNVQGGMYGKGSDVYNLFDLKYNSAHTMSAKVFNDFINDETFTLVSDKKFADGGTMGSSMSAQGGGVIFQVGDMVKIMPNYSSHYTNSKGEIIKVMPDNKTYEVKIKHKTGNEYVKFDISELLFLGNQKKYADGGTMGSDALEAEVKTWIFRASGNIEDALRFVQYNSQVTSPFRLVYSAVRKGFIEPYQINADLLTSAIETSDDIDDTYADSGEGFGSSDMNAYIGHMISGAGITRKPKMAQGGVLNEVPDQIYLVTIIVTVGDNEGREHIFWGLEVRTQSGNYMRYIQNAYDFLNFRSTMDSKDIQVMRDYNQEADRTKTNEIIDGLVMTEIPPIYTSYSNVQHYGGAEEGGWYYHTREAIEEVTEAQYLEIESERLDSYGEGVSASEGFIFGEDEKLGREYYS